MKCESSFCLKPVYAKGLCRNHYQQDWYRRTSGPKRPYLLTLEDRFSHYTDKSGECWIWTKAKRRGYGVVRISGEGQRLAHRVAYEIANDVRLESNVVVHHKCHTPACVRPDHLEAVRQSDNCAESLDRQALFQKIQELEALLDARISEEG